MDMNEEYGLTSYETREILFYKTDNGDVRVEILLYQENLWLTQAKMAELFEVQKAAISKHLKNIFESGELMEESVVSKMETTSADGKRYNTNYYNLDAIIAVGYRVKSRKATMFRIWANRVLKEFIIKGYVMDGKVHLPYKRFLGYEKGEDGRPAVVESEARVVKLIYGLFLEGKTQAGICKYLEELGIPSPGGKQKWSKTTITSILQNEKYKGDALLQKKFTVDFLEKKMKPNEGEVPQYYVTGSHPAIIEPDEWEQVQAEFARRKTLGKAYSGKSVLSAKLVCEDCGAFFGPKVWHSTDQYRRTIWQCNGKFTNEERCHTPVVGTETIQRLFIKAYNLMMQDRVQIIKQCEAWRARLMDFGTLDADIERQLEETQVVAELVKAAVKENASTAQSQEAYLKKYAALTERYEKAAAELERLQSLRTARSQQDKKMALYIRTLKKQPEVMHDWNDTIWTVMIEKAIVHKDGQITFVFQNGMEIKTAV